jgi:lipopolysaccharide heptosyltransferase I
VRLSALGDVIHTLPLLSALREHFPAAAISWVVDERFASLLRGHQALDELITVPRAFLKSPWTLWQTRRRLQAQRFDLAIDTQGLTKSAVLAWLSGAPRRIGFKGRWGRELSPWLNTELVLPSAPHAVDRLLELLSPLGIERPRVRFEVPEEESERQAAARVLAELGVSDGFAMIHPGASWASKLWPANRFAAVARHLGEHWHLPTIVFWASPEEQGRAGEIVQGAGGHARRAPKVTLRELASLARRARLYLSSDTGPLHLAAAVGTPCVGLYGPWPAEGHGPYGPQNIAVQKMVFHGSTRQRRRCSSIYMEAIGAPTVCDACDRLLGRELLKGPLGHRQEVMSWKTA